MREIEISTKDRALKNMFWKIKMYLRAIQYGDGRCKSTNRTGINLVIDEINKYGYDYLNIGNHDNIVDLKISFDRSKIRLILNK